MEAALAAELAFPKATIPPVKVTFGEAMIFEGSESPEMTTAWLFDGPKLGGKDVV